jgi:predicted MPP superfamily phosphohydrolase
MKLTVKKDQPFKICQLTDIHLSPLPLNQESKRTIRDMTNFLKDK